MCNVCIRNTSNHTSHYTAPPSTSQHPLLFLDSNCPQNRKFNYSGASAHLCTFTTHDAISCDMVAPDWSSLGPEQRTSGGELRGIPDQIIPLTCSIHIRIHSECPKSSLRPLPLSIYLSLSVSFSMFSR